MGGRVLLKPSKECRQSAENAESFTWPAFFRIGLNGKACALRLLCEVVDRPLKNAGLLGDIINLVLRYTWQSVLNVVHDLHTFFTEVIQKMDAKEEKPRSISGPRDLEVLATVPPCIKTVRYPYSISRYSIDETL